jgi:hypothetical protein
MKLNDNGSHYQIQTFFMRTKLYIYCSNNTTIFQIVIRYEVKKAIILILLTDIQQ